MNKLCIPPYVHSFPAPAVLIGCGTLEHPNLITCSWFGTVCSEPPMVGVSIRKSRFSHGLLVKYGEFTVNVPRVSDLEIVKFCGVKSGRDTNKFRALGLTAVACPPLVRAPMINECFHTLGCRVRQMIELGSHDLFLAEVLCVYILPEDQRVSRPDPHCGEQIAYLDGKYWQLASMAGAREIPESSIEE